MTYKNFQKLVCPDCKGKLKTEKTKLNCKKCNKIFIIKNNIPRFIEEKENIETKSGKRFGYKWEKNPKINKYYEKNFIDEIYPLDKNFFKNKVVLDAGCGIGIPTYCMHKLGAKEIYSFDISKSVDIAKNNVKNNNGLFIQADIHKMPFSEKSFDIVVCVAVLQHVSNKKEAVTKLIKLVKPKGTLILWVYGREGSGFVRFVVEPLRKVITRNLPIAITHYISIPLGYQFHYLTKFIKKTNFLIPMKKYMIYRSEFPLKNNIEMVFDQLLAPLSYLFNKEEVESFLKNENIKQYYIRKHNNNSWTAIARKK